MIKITDLPFNQLIGIEESLDSDYDLCLKNDLKYTNHLGTVHASALFSLAEATCGYFLLRHFPEYQSGLIPVVRQVEVKYKKPAIGVVNSAAALIDSTIEDIKEQLVNKNRAIVKLKVDLYDGNKTHVFAGNFDWFVTVQG
jgi:acyl-coenzyme A thioesterase PaaI-like protein